MNGPEEEDLCLSPIIGFSAATQDRSPVRSTVSKRLFEGGGDDFVGFSSASGKRIALSEEALDQGRRLFEEDADLSTPLLTTKPSALRPLQEPVTKGGFTTASGRRVNVSVDAIKKAKMIFEDEEVNLMPEPFSGPSGFSSASGKKIAISSDKLLQARSMFQEDLLEEAGESDGQELNQTSKNTLQQNPNLLKKNHQAFKNHSKARTKVFSEGTPQSFPKNSCQPSRPCGFASARGKEIPISNESLQNAEKLFAEVNESYETAKPKVPPSACGFSSASGKKVVVSSAAIENAKKIFLDEDLIVTKSNEFSNRRGQVEPMPTDIVSQPSISSAGNKRQLGKEETDPQLGRAKRFKGEDKFPDGDELFEEMVLQMDTQYFEDIQFITTESALSNAEEKLVKESANGETVKITKVKSEIIEARRRTRERLEDEIKLKEVQPTKSCVQIVRNSSKDTLINLKSLGRPSDSPDDETLSKFGVRQCIRNVIGSTDAKSFIFRGEEFFDAEVLNSGDTVRFEDTHMSTVLSNSNCLGPDELFRALRTVTANRASRSWFDNHYRWVVWKLAKLEQKFPDKMGGKTLTPATLLRQILHRFNREYELGERSCLRKLYEGDDCASKCMVVVVANIWKIPFTHRVNTVFVVELTDGWYSVGWKVGQADDPFRKLIESGKIIEGTKLMTFGSDLRNLSKPCSPLEAPSVYDEVERVLLNASDGDKESFKCAFLNLNANSTRRARWFTRLGFHHRIPSMPTKFSSLLRNGGFVSEICVEVVRKYPIIYARSCQNGTTFVSEKVEISWTKRQGTVDEKLVDEIYQEVLKEFESEENLSSKERQKGAKKVHYDSIKNLVGGSDIDDAINAATDPSYLQSMLSQHQIQALENFRRQRQESLQLEIKTEVAKRLKEKYEKEGAGSSRNCKPSTPVLRVRLMDLLDPLDQIRSATLSIWRPEKDLCDQIEENSKFRIYGLSANFIRDNDVQFRTTKSTKFEKVDNKRDKSGMNEIDMSEHRRSFSDIGDIVSSGSFSPKFLEVDLIGVVVSSTTKNAQRANFETVYICDALFNFVALHFWEGIVESGYERSMFSPEATSSASVDKQKPQVYIFKNLQWRKSSSFNSSNNRSIPRLYVTETTLISGTPKNQHETKLVDELVADVQVEFLCKAKSLLSGLITATPKGQNFMSGNRITPNQTHGRREAVNASWPRASKKIQAESELPVRSTVARNPKSVISVSDASSGGSPTFKSSVKADLPVGFCGNFSALVPTEDEDPYESQLIRGSVLVEDGSPAFVQSIRNKKKLEQLKQVKWHIPFSVDSNPDNPNQSVNLEYHSKETTDATNAITKVNPSLRKLATPFRVPFRKLKE